MYLPPLLEELGLAELPTTPATTACGAIWSPPPATRRRHAAVAGTGGIRTRKSTSPPDATKLKKFVVGMSGPGAC